MEIFFLTKIQPDSTSGTTPETFSGVVNFVGRVLKHDPIGEYSYGISRRDSANYNQQSNCATHQIISVLRIWVAEGNTIPLWKEPTPLERRKSFQPLTARQFRLGMLNIIQNEIRVEKLIQKIDCSDKRKKYEIEWEYSIDFYRMSPFIEFLFNQLGYSQEFVDEFWDKSIKY